MTMALVLDADKAALSWWRQSEGKVHRAALKSHVKKCSRNSDGQSACQKINCWTEAIGGWGGAIRTI
jgi:hypothetical protein